MLLDAIASGAVYRRKRSRRLRRARAAHRDAVSSRPEWRRSAPARWCYVDMQIPRHRCNGRRSARGGSAGLHEEAAARASAITATSARRPSSARAGRCSSRSIAMRRASARRDRRTKSAERARPRLALERPVEDRHAARRIQMQANEADDRRRANRRGDSR